MSLPQAIDFEATYYDGETSHPYPVKVQAELTEVIVVGTIGTLRLPSEAVEVSDRVGSTPRVLRLPTGARLSTPDHASVDAWLRSQSRPSGSGAHRLEANWQFALLAVAVTASLAVAGSVWGVPLGARWLAEALPSSAVNSLGEGTLEALDRLAFEPTELTLARQTELRAAFAGVAERFPELPLELHFRRMHTPNAFALPNGAVVVADELTALAKSDSEVLAVLLHEIGHVHHRHGLRLAIEDSAFALLVGGYLGDVSQLTVLASALPSLYANAHFSREHETEADSFALELCPNVGVAPRHFADMLDRLSATVGAEPEGRGPLHYLMSHPSTAERVARFRDARE